jgi:ubiquinone/menaquinone biosynthesis C-methylase UbiE
VLDETLLGISAGTLSRVPVNASTSHDASDRTNGIRQFFELRVPGLLARESEVTRAIDGRCLFEVSDEAGAVGRWLVDFTSSPPTVVAGESADSDCHISLAADDLLEMIDDPSAGQVLAWQGRLHFGGDPALLRRIADVLFPSSDGDNNAYAGYYTSLSRLVPDPRLTFMNHGYAEDDEDLGWLDEADRPWRFSINLIRRTLAGTQIKGTRVLDIGCGRGGPASYIARYLHPREVIGLDACDEGIRFCESRYRDPGLRFVHGYADRVPFDDAIFDVVLNVESSHCYVDRRGFLSEVARVLKPGGAFCYADIFQSEELDHTQRLLSTLPELRVVGAADVTPQVRRAIELNRETLAELLISTTDIKLRNTAIIADLIRRINVQMYENYVSGRWGYHVWRIEKAEQ